MYRTVQVGIPESAGIRETMLALRRAIGIDEIPACGDAKLCFSRGLDAVMDAHGEVSVSGMVRNPTITIKCVDDGQEWPCPTIRALCAALRVKWAPERLTDQDPTARSSLPVPPDGASN